MAQCQFTSAKKPVCRANAVRGSDFCIVHQVAAGFTKGMDLEPEAGPEVTTGPEGPEGPEGSPRLGAERLIAGRREREAERQSRPAAMALQDPGEYKVSVEEMGARIAIVMHRAEMKSRQAFMERGKPRRYAESGGEDGEHDGYRLDDGEGSRRSAPMKVLTRRTRPDATRIVDPVTKQPPASLRDDFAHRWVSTVDWQDRPTEHRVAEYEDYGWEFVTDAKGRPIEGRFGVAMQGPAEQYAARMLDRTPTGAFQRDDSLAAADEIAQAINRRVGDQVVQVVAERDHGKRYSQVPLGREKEFDV